jgi:tetratricopeptide (TPR) repeat protein
MPNKKVWTIAGVCAGLVAIVWFVFGQTIRFPFINFDDPTYTYEAPEVIAGLSWHRIVWAFTHVQAGNWHPLTIISHMLDCELFGLHAGGHHFVNVLLHGLTVVGLFLVLRTLTGAMWRSAFVAAVFAVHPLRVESVVWIAERKDVLSGLFFVLTLLAYAWYTRRPSLGRYLLMSIVFACGLMSKPMLVTLPIILLLLDYWPLKRPVDVRTCRKLVVEKVPLFLLAVASSIATLIAQKSALGSFEQLPFFWRVSNAVLSYLIYLRQMFWPANLAVFYPHPDNSAQLWHVVIAAVLLIAITMLVAGQRKLRPYLVVGWFWYVCMLIPVVGIVQVGLQGHADRYTYLPQIGLYLAITWFVSELFSAQRHHRMILTTSALAVIGVLTGMSSAQTSYWKDSESLWNQAIANTSNNHLAHAHLADLLLRNGRIKEAIYHCQEAIRIQPNDSDAQNNLGLAYLQLTNEADAVAHLEQSLTGNPKNLNARCNLAWILATSMDASRRNGRRAVELANGVAQGPGRGNPIVLRTLAAAYAENGQFNDAIEAAQQAIAIARASRNEGLAADLERNIASYRLNQPIRSGTR